MAGMGLPLSYQAQSNPAMSAREVENEMRIDLFMRTFDEAERGCGLRFAEGVTMEDRAQAIVRAAKGVNLEPRLYQFAWLVQKISKNRR
jgi:hypothetical protein